MIEITPSAREALDGYLAQNPGQVVKIRFAGLECSGPVLKLSLAAPEEHETVVDVNGMAVVLDEETTVFSDDQTIDYLKTDEGEGFCITSSGGFSCGGDCSSCGG